jgi:transposase-like protein
MLKRLESNAKNAGDCWYIDEINPTINEKCQHLWRAVNQNGKVLDVPVRARKNKLIYATGP